MSNDTKSTTLPGSLPSPAKKQDPVSMSRANRYSNTPQAGPSDATPGTTKSSILDRAFSKKNTETGKKFLSAYAKTWVGMSPLWLMGEAVIPGRKVGTTFKRGGKSLISIAEEMQDELSTSAKDILVIIDNQFKDKKDESGKMAEVVKAAGSDLILLVTSNIDRAQDQIKSNSPKLKQSIASHGRDVVILADKSLKNPIVVTGITKFARSRGIPFPEAILQVAALGLAKLLEAIPELEDKVIDAELKAGIIEEIDAEELHRTATESAEREAEKLGKYGAGPGPQVEEVGHGEGKGKGKEGGGCVIG